MSVFTYRDQSGVECVLVSKRVRVECPICRRNVSGRTSLVLDGWFKVRFHHGPTGFDTKRCPGVGKVVRPVE